MGMAILALGLKSNLSYMNIIMDMITKTRDSFVRLFLTLYSLTIIHAYILNACVLPHPILLALSRSYVCFLCRACFYMNLYTFFLLDSCFVCLIAHVCKLD